ncbi:MAG: flippase-like domain-containing protein, partial [Chloroflexota bacterium]|nr:flippase-like domain-containing protein [Chloroflexota bacterium]
MPDQPASRRARLRRMVLFTVTPAAAAFFVAGGVVSWRLAGTASWSAAALRWVPLLLLLGVGSYSLRFLRWHSLVRRVSPDLSVSVSARIYVAGFSLGLTPGRVGELFKFSLLRDVSGVAELRSAPIFLVERATEAASFLSLAVAGAVLGRLPMSALTGRSASTLLLLAGL